MNETKNVLDKLLTKSADYWDEYGWPLANALMFLQPINEWITSKVAGIKSGDKVLNLGSGYPLYEIGAQKVGKNGLFVALDINRSIQSRSKKILYWFNSLIAHDAKSTQVVGDNEHIPFPEETFDVVIGNNLLSHDVNTMQEARRVMKTGASIVFSYAEVIPFLPFGTLATAKECRKAGFDNVRVRPGLPNLIGLTNSPVAVAVTPGMRWYVLAEKG